MSHQSSVGEVPLGKADARGRQLPVLPPPSHAQLLAGCGGGAGGGERGAGGLGIPPPLHPLGQNETASVYTPRRRAVELEGAATGVAAGGGRGLLVEVVVIRVRASDQCHAYIHGYPKYI